MIVIVYTADGTGLLDDKQELIKTLHWTYVQRFEWFVWLCRKRETMLFWYGDFGIIVYILRFVDGIYETFYTKVCILIV